MWAASGVLRPRDAGKATGEGTRSATWQSSRDWSGTSCGLFPPFPGRCLGSTSSLPCPGGCTWCRERPEGSPHLTSPAPHLCLGSSVARTGNPACACVHAMWVHIRECEQVRGVGTCICRCRVRVCTWLSAGEGFTGTKASLKAAVPLGPLSRPHQGSRKTGLLEAAVEQDGSQQPGCLRPLPPLPAPLRSPSWGRGPSPPPPSLTWD